MRIKIIDDDEVKGFEDEINEFISDKEVIDIKYCTNTDEDGET